MLGEDSREAAASKTTDWMEVRRTDRTELSWRPSRCSLCCLAW